MLTGNDENPQVIIRVEGTKRAGCSHVAAVVARALLEAGYADVCVQTKESDRSFMKLVKNEQIGYEPKPWPGLQVPVTIVEGSRGHDYRPFSLTKK